MTLPRWQRSTSNESQIGLPG